MKQANRNQVTANEIARHALIGAASGIFAAFAMEMFQRELPRITKAIGLQQTENTKKGAQSASPKEPEPATVVVAQAVSTMALGHELRESEKKWAGEAIHYAFGASVGALFGALSVAYPVIRKGAGFPFGTAVFLLADEAAVPVLGFSKKPTQYSASTHLYAFLSHLVYGGVLNLTERKVSGVWQSYNWHSDQAAMARS